jgi:hypothetical protein
MFLKAEMAVLCTAGIAFYVRFLVALWNECKPRSAGYWVRLRLGSGEETTANRPRTRSCVRKRTCSTTPMFSPCDGAVRVEPRGKLRKRREYDADNYMELVKTELSNARVH